jgi:hypothetical protein
MLVARFSDLACPADPFVAVLDGPYGSLDTATVDLPQEGKTSTSPAAIALPSSPALIEPGHTYFSYSMQAGSADPAAHLGPKMSRFLPVIGERNPFDEPALEFSGDPTEGSEAGNSFNRAAGGEISRSSTAGPSGSTTPGACRCRSRPAAGRPTGGTTSTTTATPRPSRSARVRPGRWSHAGARPSA